MSMWAPMEAGGGSGDGDDGIPAADPGAGAPEPAEGFGIGGEEPDRPEERQPSADDGGQHADPPDRPPGPGDLTRGDR
jgi:hypothetical protein